MQSHRNNQKRTEIEYEDCKNDYALVAIAFCASAVFAQDYPAKVIVPYTAGSATGVFGRMVGAKLSELWGQPVTVENIPGANAVGADAAAKSSPDGYTLLVHSNAFAVHPSLYAKMPYNPAKAFVDIAPIARQSLALVVGKD